MNSHKIEISEKQIRFLLNAVDEYLAQGLDADKEDAQIVQVFQSYLINCPDEYQEDDYYVCDAGYKHSS